MSVTTSPRGNRLFRGLSADERKRQRREQLIEAGMRAFGSRGFHEVGVRDICAEAKLTERYFYESFSNREALFLAVYDRGIVRVREAIVAALEGSNSAEQMARAGLRAFLCMLRDEPMWARIILIDVMSVGPAVGTQSFEATRDFADLVGKIVEALYPERGLDPQLVANGLVGSTVYLVMRWAQGGFVEPLEKVLEHCALFYDALMVGHEAKPLAPGALRAPASA